MKYFTLSELTASATARRLRIDNTPPADAARNLTALVDNILDPLRLAWGAPVIVTSGYRCPQLNKAVGGAARSQHLTGQAADIRTVSDHPDDNLRLLRCLIGERLPFDQLIAEFVDGEHRPDWIHVSYAPNPRGLMYTVSRGGKLSKGIKI